VRRDDTRRLKKGFDPQKKQKETNGDWQLAIGNWRLAIGGW
jgi:hypothetical protein